MKKSLSFISILLGIIAGILVFTELFKTPPVPILIFSIFGVITGVTGFKEQKSGAAIGIILNVVALGYLLYLFISLGS